MTLSKKIHKKEAKKIYKETKSSTKTAEILCEKYGFRYSETESRKIRSWFGKKKDDEVKIDEVFKKAQEKDFGAFSKYTLITCAQNATPVNKAVFDNIKAYAKHLDAKVEVIPIRYKNPTSVFTDKQESAEWWDDSIHDYMIAKRHKVHKNVVSVADIKMQLTAAMPLTSMESLTAEETAILGHPRQHFKTTPRLLGQQPKFIASTGTITKPNYTDSKAGKRGEFHHTYGFIILEDLGEGEFTFRQVSIGEDGSFYDLDYYISNKEVVQKDCIEGVVLGDLHLGEAVCETTLECSLKMLKRFSPKNVIVHDVMDGYTINPHEMHDPFILAKKEREGKVFIEKELREVLDFLNTILEYNPVVVKSNHDIFVDRFLLGDWRKGIDKTGYLKYAYLRSEGLLPNGILPYEIEKEFGDRVKCLTEDCSFKISGIETGQHGHIGVSGSRGSLTQFKRLNTKIITAHTHSPQKQDGAIIVGTNTKLKQGYTKGLSTWWNSNVIIHPNGKAQNLLIFNGKYTNL